MNTSRKKLGEILIEAGLISKADLEKALELQQKKFAPLGDILVNNGFISEQQLYKTLENMLRIPYVELVTIKADPEAILAIPEHLAIKHMAIPIRKVGNELTVVMSDPLNYHSVDELRVLTGMDIKECIAPASEIMTAINRYYGNEGAQKAVEDMSKEYTLTELSGLAEMSDNEVSNAPVVRLVNSIISHATKSRASDIHIEPTEDTMYVRFRIDGELQEAMHSSMATHPAVITRIKIIGGMDIAEKRIPQDGRVEFKLDDVSVDLRLSILPTVYGEKVVIRILGQQGLVLTKSGLGFSQENLELLEKIIKNPNGIILVSGPTGSGKTTTLYTVLTGLSKPTVNVITVEDPVEYKLKGINQVQVNEKSGLTFANGLRSILRQDPDIIMIGEIRDVDTAQIAIRASITGHLVLSTIHTNDSASTVARLIDMGIDPYLVSSSVIGVISQRLVRKICLRCKTSYHADHTEMTLLNINEPRELYKGTGCPACNFTGYYQRTAIHEILAVTKEIRELIDRRASVDSIRSTASANGMKSLRESCTQLVLNGTTTISELTRITYSFDV